MTNPRRPASRRLTIVLTAGLLGGCSSAASTAPAATTTTSPASTTTLTPTTTPSTTTTVAPTTTTDPRPNATELAIAADFAARAGTMMASGDVHAISVAVRRRDEVLGEYALGTSSTDSALTPTSPFRMASVSKVLTAITVLQLAEEGAIDLDRTLAEQWTGRFAVTDARVRSITVRQLLQHTSGIASMKNTFFIDGGITWHQAADLAIAGELLYDPGTGYRYSNANYVLLGRLVEQVTGTTIDAAITAHVLQPLGISTARMNTDTHSFDPNGPKYVVGRLRQYLEALGPAGDWEMSAGDMAKVMVALQPSSPTPLLRVETMAEMLTPTTLPDDEENWSYGLGLMVGPTWFGHTGTIEDVRAVALDLANGYTVVVLAATDALPNGEALIDAFAAEIFALATLPSH